jgi:acyl-CoA dehydrogenase
MAYEGATGWLVGPPHGGMAAMFTMMNNARLGVGVQGVGVAEAATQAATAYATERRQGGRAIAEYPDVRRMLAEMRAETFAARAIAMACAVALDMAQATGDPDWRTRAALLTPIAKAFGTDTGHAVAQTGIQVHGGMGFIEETGAAQFARDVRVTQIYEGTNGIQALDLVGRKLNDGGAAALALLGEIEGPEARALEEATRVLAARPLPERAPGATAYLRAFARVLGADAHRRAARLDPARASLARFQEARLLPEVGPLVAQALSQDLPTAEELAA